MRREFLLIAALAAPAAASPESAAFLKIGVGARPLGMGGAYTAVADDADAVAWNPAGLSRLGRPEVEATHAELFADTRYDFLSYGLPTRYGAFGASLAYLSQAAIPGRDAAGAPTGNYSASDAAAGLTYAARSRSVAGLRWGLGVKFIRSVLADTSAETAAADGGVQYESRLGPGSALFGAVIQNLGPGLKFVDERAPLPLTAAGGVGYRFPCGLLLAADEKYRTRSHSSEASVGAEWTVLAALALRLGYDSGAAAVDGATGLASLSGFTAGFGVRLYGFSLDYAMTPLGELGNAQRFGLDFRF